MTKILLVEDDKSLREIYGVRLLAEGYDIVSAGDGEEALAMAIKERPQLIISDVMMPKISGFDMLDILRSTTETKDIRVIMMTALSSEDQRARGEQLGADRYLVKSQVGIEDVVRTVHEVLGDAPVATVGGASMGPSSTPSAPASTPAPPAPSSSSAPVRPTTPPAPSPQPSPSPVPAASTPAPTPAPSTGLPQPTAPFSTQRPANLGERVIHPPEKTGNEPDVAAMLDRELNDLKETPEFSDASDVEPLTATQPPAPATPTMPQPPAPPPPQQPPQAVPTTPAIPTTNNAPQAPTTPAPNQAAAAQPTPPQPNSFNQ